MHIIDILPIAFVSGVFLFFAFKITTVFFTARRSL